MAVIGSLAVIGTLTGVRFCHFCHFGTISVILAVICAILADI